MPKTYILEPLACDDKEKQERGKKLWASVKKQLNSYGFGSEIVHTFSDMLQDLHMSYSDYILAVCSTLVRAQFFPQRKPCEIRINNYMRKCLHIWRANHDIQPCLNPYAVVKVERAEVVLHSSFLWSLRRLVRWRGFRTAQGTVLNRA